jgi:hypothetical protein
MFEPAANIPPVATGTSPARAGEIGSGGKLAGAGALEALKSIAAALQEGRPVSLRHGQWLAAAVADYEQRARDGVTLCGALGISPNQGERAWWLDHAINVRDEALRAHAQLVASGKSTRAAAHAVHADLNRYQTTRWRLDRALRPDAIELLPDDRRHLAKALKTGTKAPGLRQLQTILAEPKVCNSQALRIAHSPLDDRCITR